MSHVHGGNSIRCRNFLEKCIDRFLMQTGLEEVLQFWEHLVHVRIEIGLSTHLIVTGNKVSYEVVAIVCR